MNNTCWTYLNKLRLSDRVMEAFLACVPHRMFFKTAHLLTLKIGTN